MENPFVAILLGLSISTMASAQHIPTESDTVRIKEINLDEVTVLSIKETTEKLRDLPAAATSLGSSVVESREMTSVKDVTALVPNLFMPDYGSKLTSPIYIRGVGSKINSPSVGLYVDDVPYFEKAAFDFELSDIERIEVIRGPQGTLYGRNTMGGIINVYTKNPGNIPSARILLGGGDYGLKRTQASVYAPVTSNSAISISSFFTENDGYFVNQYSGDKVDKSTSFGGHVKYKLHLGEKLNLSLMSSVERLNQGGYPYAEFVDSTRVTKPINYNHASGYDRDLWSNAFTLTYRHNGTLVRWVTSHQYLKDYQDIDQDFSAANTYVVAQDMKQNVLAQEIILKQQFTDRISWLAGIWAFKQWSLSQLDLTTNGAHSYTKYYDNPTYGTAAFTEIKISDLLLDGLSLTAGLRIDRETQEMDYLHNRTVNNVPEKAAQFDHSLNFDQILPKLAVSYQLATNANTYATVTKGYKTGGFNTSFERTEDETFLPEYSWNYEVGFKGSGFGNKLNIGLCAFYIDWKDQQVTQPVYPSKKGTMLKNAGESNSKGIEVEINARPLTGLDLALSYGLTDARFNTYYRDTVDLADPSQAIDYGGNYFPLVPKNTAMASVSYHLPLRTQFFTGILVNCNYQGVGKIYWTDDNKGYQDYYGLLNGKLSLQTLHLKLEIWGKNLTAQDYHGFYFPLSGKSYVQMGKPRTFGVNLVVTI
ncbi:MAG: TonB-dependent receptor [Breznakibacter sp.]